MAVDPKDFNYAAIVAEAESAVAGVKDPELRRVAFEKILGTLLESSPARSKSAPRRARTSLRKNSRTTDSSPTRTARRGPMTLIEELIAEGYFKQQRTLADVKVELANRGHHIPITSLSTPLQRLTQKKKLRRQRLKDGGKDSKAMFQYSNWV